MNHVVDTRNVEDIFIRDLVLKTYPICASEIWFGLPGVSTHQSCHKAGIVEAVKLDCVFHILQFMQ